VKKILVRIIVIEQFGCMVFGTFLAEPWALFTFKISFACSTINLEAVSTSSLVMPLVY
jgi:hypothetical protein